MLKISLEGLEFFAYHGFYKSERQMGNKYSVDVAVNYADNTAGRKDELSTTVNYEKIYQAVKEEMSIPSKLLEHIANRVAKKIFVNFEQVKAIEIIVRKFNPPVGGVCHSASVELFLERDNL